MPPSEQVRRRLSWSVLALACVSYLLLASAEQRVSSSSIAVPPDAPLPFARHRVFGIDLRHLTSLEARDWLLSAGSEPLALVALPIDADVVLALTQVDQQPRALAAIDSMMAAAGGSPIAACLHRPPTAVSGAGIAQAAVTALLQRYPNQITYLAACPGPNAGGWQQQIADVVVPLVGNVSPDALLPLSSGAMVRVDTLDGLDDLEAAQLSDAGGAGYTILVLDVVQPLTGADVERAAQALAASATAALILVQPERELDPSTVVASIQPALAQRDVLVEGFTSIAGPGIGLSEGWQSSTVGMVPYLRSAGPDASLVVDVIATDVYLIGLLSPDGGEIAVWIDPDVSQPDTPPDLVANVTADQARDAAIPIATDLPAARHRIVLQALPADGTSVTISGLFVAGRPGTSWTGLLASVTLIALATAALAERSYAAVVAIRAGVASGRERSVYGHPRGFSRRT